MAQFNHDPKLVQLIIGGRGINEFQEGSGITLEPSSDVSTTSMGVDKSFTRNINTNIYYNLTFTLQNGSPSNTYLNSLINSGVAVPFMLKDGNTGNTNASGTTYVQAIPSISGQLEASGREYKFTCVDVLWNVGGVS